MIQEFKLSLLGMIMVCVNTAISPFPHVLFCGEVERIK